MFIRYSNDAPGSFWADKFEDLIDKRPGIGNRCLNPDIYTME